MFVEFFVFFGTNKLLLFANTNFGGKTMKKEVTTKDLMALNELMTFENWMATKMKFCSENVVDKSLKTMFKDMAAKHLENHKKLLKFLQSASEEGGDK